MSNQKVIVSIASVLAFDVYGTPTVTVSFVAFGGAYFYTGPSDGDRQVPAQCSGTFSIDGQSKLSKYSLFAQIVLEALLASAYPDGLGLTVQQYLEQHGGVPAFDYVFVGDSLEYLITPEAEAQLA